MMFIEILNLIATYYYLVKLKDNINIYPIIYKSLIILPISEKKSIYVYPWMLYMIYLYKAYIPYIFKLSFRNIFIISLLRFIYNIKNCKIIDNNPFIEN